MNPAENSLTLEVTEVAFGGKGVARHEGKVIFVPGVLPNETVRAVVTREHRTYSEARLLEVVTPSAARIAPVCPLAVRAGGDGAAPVFCPGCSYQHVAYAEEVRIKTAHLQTALASHVGAAPAVVQRPVVSPLDLGYRNKIVLHAQARGEGMALGYVAEDNVTVVDVPACPLAAPPLNALLARLHDDAGFRKGLRDGMSVTLRYTARDGALHWRRQAAANETWLVEASTLGPVSVPRNSFYQVNTLVGDLLVEQVTRLLRELDAAVCVDLFCGVGVFALAAARLGVREVVGVDSDAEAIRAAEHNARRLELAGVHWVCGPAERALAAVGKSLQGPRGVLLVDPPRAGLGQRLIRHLARNAPGTILYVSCAADTMARDAAWLQEAGYRLDSSRVLDMFPRTCHFESLTRFSRT